MNVHGFRSVGRSEERESFWRLQLERQSSSGESIRGYCHRQGISEAAFYFWRREIVKRDREAFDSGGHGRGPAGFVAVTVVEDHSRTSIAANQIANEVVSPAANQTLEIECPGGPVVRLREDVSLEILERVMFVCRQQVGTSEVRSC